MSDFDDVVEGEVFAEDELAGQLLEARERVELYEALAKKARVELRALRHAKTPTEANDRLGAIRLCLRGIHPVVGG